MPRIAYVNGRFVPHRDARVHIEDRGYQFSDGVYEVVGIVGGRMVDEELHFRRLERSLREIRMPAPFTPAQFAVKVERLVRLNRIDAGALYLQVSRGVAARDHRLPGDIRPAVVMTVRPFRPPPAGLFDAGVSVITAPDQRWKRPDIKSVGLLANILAKDDAVAAGAYETWQYDSAGRVTEGASTNAWIVDADGTVVTRAADGSILDGVTRQALIRIAADNGVPVAERPFGVDEALGAAEAFLTSTTALLIPVVRIDGHPVGAGVPGPRSRELLALYRAHFWGRGRP